MFCLIARFAYTINVTQIPIQKPCSTWQPWLAVYDNTHPHHTLMAFVHIRVCGWALFSHTLSMLLALILTSQTLLPAPDPQIIGQNLNGNSLVRVLEGCKTIPSRKL